MFLPLVIVSASSSFVFGKDCILPFLCFILLFSVLYITQKIILCDAITVVIYVAGLYVYSVVFGIMTGVFLGLTSFVSSVFGRKGVIRASCIISSLSFVFLILALVFREESISYGGSVRYVFTLISSFACATCTEYGYFKTLIPVFCGFAIGAVFGICGGIFGEIFSLASAYCTLSVVFSFVSLFKNEETDTYNKNG